MKSAYPREIQNPRHGVGFAFISGKRASGISFIMKAMEQLSGIAEKLHIGEWNLDGITAGAQAHSVLIVTVLFLLLMTWMGWRRGFLAKAISLGSVLLTIYAEMKIFPHVASYLESSEAVHEFFLNQARGLMQIETNTPHSLLYDLLGLNALADNAANLMENLAAKVICFALIFLVVRLLLCFVSMLARGIRRISIIRRLDGLLGALFGLLESILLVWVVMLVASGLPGVPVFHTILEQIAESRFLSLLYSQNLLIQLFADIFR